MTEEIERFSWDRERLDLIKKTYAKGTNDAEFELFISVCNRLRLDPMAGQIYCMPTSQGKGKDKVTTYKAVVGIDGFRSLADETGEYMGQTKPEWFDETIVDSTGKQVGGWVDVWFGSNPPVAARIGIHRRGFVEPLYRVARYDAYVQMTYDGTPNWMWGKMHAEQLLKCAESVALRAAFPRKLAGVYTTDEMAQAESAERATERPKVDGRLSDKAQQSKPANAPQRVVFKWNANPKYNNTFVEQAPADVITEYITFLNNTYLMNEEKKGTWGEVRALKRQCEDILRIQLLLEQKPLELSDGASIGSRLQDIIDGRLTDPSDANTEWGMSEQPDSNH